MRVDLEKFSSREYFEKIEKENKLALELKQTNSLNDNMGKKNKLNLELANKFVDQFKGKDNSLMAEEFNKA